MKKFLQNVFPPWFAAPAIYTAVFLIFLTIMRAIFLFAFRSFISADSLHEIAKAFYIGMKFDLRLLCILAAPLLLYCMLAWFFKRLRIAKRFFVWLYTVAACILLLVYFVDFGFYAYLNTRLNSFILSFAQNPLISLHMVWESYPVVWGTLGLVLFGWITYIFTRKCVNYAFANDRKYGWKLNTPHIIGAILITAACIYGQVSAYPLRWSNAYHSTNNFICDLTVNPILNFASTYSFAKNDGYDEEAVRKHYDIMAKFLNVDNPDKEKLDFERNVPADPKKPQRDYNVVFVFMESLAWNKTSISLNSQNGLDPQYPVKNNTGIDPTPFAKELADKSLLFTRIFTPTPATARAVFATLTSLPDTSSFESNSRNPLIVDQRMLGNDLKGYDKYYFIGGSANWGNIRGILSHNMEGLKIYEEEDFPISERNDVWGISDLALFRKANKVFSEQKKPFLAYIQTAGYHRPYTIPDDNDGFVEDNPSEEAVRKYSFGSVKEYNSMRFQDYSLKRFFDMAREHDYFKKTIFVIYGDHGLSAPESANVPKGFVEYNLINNHIPLIVHADFIKPQIVRKTGSQLDIWPTVMSLMNRPYSTGALGRDILNPKNSGGAFIFGLHRQPNTVNFLQDYLYYMSDPADPKGGHFYDVSGDRYKEDQRDNKKLAAGGALEIMPQLAEGFYETSRWIKYHNKKISN